MELLVSPTLDTRPRVRVERILRQWIADGKLPVGVELPTELSLAKALKVSRPTLRLAMRQLQDQGLIISQENRRRVVADQGAAHGGAMAQSVVVLGCAFPKGRGENDYQRSSGWGIQRQYAALAGLGEAGFDSMIVGERTLTAEKARRLMSGRPRGAIAVESEVWDTAEAQQIADALRLHGAPVVLYGSQPIAGCDRVSSDHAAGCHDLTRWLIGQGRRRILRVWTGQGCQINHAWLKDRDAGYEKAMGEAGLEILPVVRPGGPEPEGLAFQQWFEAKTRSIVGWLIEHLQRDPAIDAIVAASDGEVYPIAAACRLLGKTPGRDILITGYDDFWMDDPQRQFESYTPAATVDKQNPAIGLELVKLFQDRLNGKLPVETQHRVIAPQMIVVDPDAPNGSSAPRQTVETN